MHAENVQTYLFVIALLILSSGATFFFGVMWGHLECERRNHPETAEVPTSEPVLVGADPFAGHPVNCKCYHHR